VVKINFLETTYDYVLNTVFNIANPIKKVIIKTECEVHKFINIQSLFILKNDNYVSEYNFFHSYIVDINKGAEWADQDFKSSNHFYNPYNKKSKIYGRKSALDLGVDYYYQAITLWKKGEFKKSLFFLGAAMHIVQDMTIPQHANIRLLDDHRQFETFVKRTYNYVSEFRVKHGTYLLSSIESYIKFNSRVAIKIYKKYSSIADDENRFYCITKCALPLAKRTTAGVMIMFYRDIFIKKRYNKGLS